MAVLAALLSWLSARAEVLSAQFKALFVELSLKLCELLCLSRDTHSLPLWNISMLLSLKAAPQPPPGCGLPPPTPSNPALSVLCSCSHCFKAGGSCTAVCFLSFLIASL